MTIGKREFLFPAFWVGLILATYFGLGEFYLLFAAGLTAAFYLSRTSSWIKVCWKDPLKIFVIYYILISIVGITINYVGIKDFIELIIKYVCLPIIIFSMIPNNHESKINMLTAFKLIIFISAVYGLFESLIQYNIMADIVKIDARAWMETMNSASRYQPCSFFLHYNYYGFVLIMGIILVKYVPYKNKILNMAYWLIVLEQICICQSRICWIATIIVLFIILIQNKKITDKKAQIASVILLAGVCVILLKPSILEKIWIFVSDRFARLWIYGFEDGSLGQRVGTLLNWPIYFFHNIIAGFFGTGYQSIDVKYMKEYSFFEGYSTADCELTVYLVETGLVGVIILAFAIFWFLRQKGILEMQEANLRRMGKLGLIAGLVECATLDVASNNIIFSLLIFFLLIGKSELQQSSFYEV